MSPERFPSRTPCRTAHPSAKGVGAARPDLGAAGRQVTDGGGSRSGGSLYTSHDRERWVPEDRARKRADRDDFARDRARLVHSSGFRRLASKTQVVAPYAGDFARNRLTHSLEVAQIGREMALFVGCNANVVDAACLAHDLGHPPFGHNGEAELDRWAASIGGFEGNAQTLRLLTRLEPKRFHPDGHPAGLNLTRATLDASVKYPWSVHERPDGSHKFGYYDDDAPVFAWLRQGDAPGVAAPGDKAHHSPPDPIPQGLHLADDTSGQGTNDASPPRTSVEAQVMDWSDDVAYSVHDVEDAVAARYIDLRVLGSTTALADVATVARNCYEPGIEEAEFFEAGRRLLTEEELPTSFDGTRAALAALKDMTSRLIGRFVAAAETATRKHHGPVPLVRYGGHIEVPRSTRAECALLKALANAYVMQAPGHLAVMEREREVITALAEAYWAAPEERLDADLRGDWEAAPDDAARRRVVVDQVASLTDTRALVLHARWCEPTLGFGR